MMRDERSALSCPATWTFGLRWAMISAVSEVGQLPSGHREKGRKVLQGRIGDEVVRVSPALPIPEREPFVRIDIESDVGHGVAEMPHEVAEGVFPGTRAPSANLEPVQHPKGLQPPEDGVVGVKWPQFPGDHYEAVQESGDMSGIDHVVAVETMEPCHGAETVAEFPTSDCLLYHLGIHECRLRYLASEVMHVSNLRLSLHSLHPNAPDSMVFMIGHPERTPTEAAGASEVE